MKCFVLLLLRTSKFQEFITVFYVIFVLKFKGNSNEFFNNEICEMLFHSYGNLNLKTEWGKQLTCDPQVESQVKS